VSDSFFVKVNDCRLIGALVIGRVFAPVPYNCKGYAKHQIGQSPRRLAGGPVVNKIKRTIPRVRAPFAAAIAWCLSSSMPAAAADLRVAPDTFYAPPPQTATDWSYKGFDGPSTYVGEFGLRFWYGRGSTGKSLYDNTGALVSRLTYGDLSVFAGEAFTRLDFNNGWFLKGYAGGAGLFEGKLKDEDFPPGINPYSATLSGTNNGSKIYGSVDGGFKIFRGPDFHVGAFVGYHFMRDTLNANGCGQIATNTSVCASGVPDIVRSITQVNDWNSVRVGLDAAVEYNRLKLSVDAAYLPYVHLSGSDTHWLRLDPTNSVVGAFNSAIPEDGSGWGVQIDGLLSYRLSDAVSVGIGGRYWHMETQGQAHFEGHVIGFVTPPQPVNWKVDNFGVFLQSSVKLGPYPLFGVF
jgi:hypothetical protein